MATSSGARQFVTWAPLAALLIVLLPAPSAAQEPVKSFDQLNTRLKPGDTVWITDAQGREVKGKITELHDASITLESDGPTTLQADSVRLVQRSTKSVGKAALWGMLVGSIVFVALGAAGAAGGSQSEDEMLPAIIVLPIAAEVTEMVIAAGQGMPGGSSPAVAHEPVPMPQSHS